MGEHGEPASAVKVLAAADSLAPGNPLVLSALASAYYRAGDSLAASLSLGTLRSNLRTILHPETKAVLANACLLAHALHKAGRASLRSGMLAAEFDLLANRPREALDTLSPLENEAEGEPDFYKLLGLAQARLNHTPEAIRAHRQALRLAPGRQDLLLNLAAAYQASRDITLKSGTNSFHGQMFEFMRNPALDARNFFDYSTGRRLPNSVQNQFGFAFGGPVAKNKTFFFVDYQGFRQRQGQSFVATVPNESIRTGTFMGTARPIYDPNTYNPATNTRQPFAGNLIPAGRFNPVSLNVLKYYPPGGGQTLANGETYFYSGASRSNNQDSFDIKLNQSFGEEDQLSARFSYGDSNTVLPGAFSNLPEYAAAIGGALTTGGAGLLTRAVSNPARSVGVQEIRNFNPTTINDFRVAYVRAGSDATQLGFGRDYASQLGIPNVNITPDNSGFPQIGMSGFSTLGDTAFFPLIELENVYQWLDNVTFIRGSHTFKAGVDFKKVQRNFTQILGAPAGSFSFGPNFTADPLNPGNTGNAFADFLLGVPTSANIVTTSGLAGIRSTEFSAYFQDTWKVTPPLTLSYGLRYDLFTPQTEVYDRQSNIDPITGKLVLPGEGGSYPRLSTRALVSTNKLNLAPRFGIAYRLGDRTVMRASYGLFYMPESQAGQQMTLNPPFVGGNNFTNTPQPQQINRTLDQGLPASSGLIPRDNPRGSFNARFPENHTAYTQQWSFSMERQIAPALLLETNYVGNLSLHLQDQFNLNQPYSGTGQCPGSPTILLCESQHDGLYVRRTARRGQLPCFSTKSEEAAFAGTFVPYELDVVEGHRESWQQLRKHRPSECAQPGCRPGLGRC